MKVRAFSVYDAKLEAYMPPFFMQTKGQAMRAFTDTVNDPNSQFNKHPEDFTLFEIAEYDDSNALISSHEAKIPLGSALEFLKKGIQ